MLSLDKVIGYNIGSAIHVRLVPFSILLSTLKEDIAKPVRNPSASNKSMTLGPLW
jgi:hypothetical protein